MTYLCGTHLVWKGGPNWPASWLCYDGLSQEAEKTGRSATVPPSVGGSHPSYSMRPIAKEKYVGKTKKGEHFFPSL